VNLTQQAGLALVTLWGLAVAISRRRAEIRETQAMEKEWAARSRRLLAESQR
jgi:hypothetical protein